jgi:hypothetical protein
MSATSSSQVWQRCRPWQEAHPTRFPDLLRHVFAAVIYARAVGRRSVSSPILIARALR